MVQCSFTTKFKFEAGCPMRSNCGKKTLPGILKFFGSSLIIPAKRKNNIVVLLKK